MKSYSRDYRVQILIRRRGEPVASSVEIKTEYCDDLEDLNSNMNDFTNDTINELEEGNDEDDESTVN